MFSENVYVMWLVICLATEDEATRLSKKYINLQVQNLF